MGAGFLVGALKGWLDKKAKDKQSRAAYDARFANNPAWALRNQMLTALWNDNHLRDRFAGAFPDPTDPKYAGMQVKTPENVLMNLTTPPRYQGRPGTGFDFASLLLGEGVRAAQSAAAAGGGATSAGAAGGGGMPIPVSGGSGSTGLDAPIVPFDGEWDPFRYRKDR